MIGWLSDGENWRGPSGAGVLLWEHVWYSVLALLLAFVLIAPLGLWLGHVGRGGALALNVGNIGRAVPTFALLVLLIIAPAPFGKNAFSVVTALFLFAIPPILTNAYVGVREVDRAAVDAARGMGMSGFQVLRRVEPAARRAAARAGPAARCGAGRRHRDHRRDRRRRRARRASSPRASRCRTSRCCSAGRCSSRCSRCSRRASSRWCSAPSGPRRHARRAVRQVGRAGRTQRLSVPRISVSGLRRLARAPLRTRARPTVARDTEGDTPMRTPIARTLRRTAVVGAGALLLSLTACGGDDAFGSGSGSSGSASGGATKTLVVGGPTFTEASILQNMYKPAARPGRLPDLHQGRRRAPDLHQGPRVGRDRHRARLPREHPRPA
nr:ABC transporter permease subunit [Angustibacter aerolatus]